MGLLIHRLFGVSIRNSEQVWKELSTLLTRRAAYKSGRYNEFYSGDYIGSLVRVADELEKDSYNPFNPQNVKYARTVREAREVAEDLRLQDMNTLLRRQPFGVIIGGEPGTGKSMTAMKIGALILELSGVKPTQKNMITLNEGDDFQSEFRSHHKCVIFDDLGATNTQITGQDPFRKVIDFINNVPRTSLNPHLELKGNVWIEPEVVVATTNLDVPFKPGQGNNTESLMCREAVNRRFKVTLKQLDYNTYKIVTPNLSRGREHQPYFYSVADWKQVEFFIRQAYQEHSEGQRTYLALMEDIIPNGVRADLRPESSGYGWYLVIALQSVLRFLYHRQILEGNWSGDAIILLNLRRFLAVPLDQIRSAQRKEIMKQLFELGFSRRHIASLLDMRATATRILSGLIPTVIAIVLDVVHGRSYSHRISEAVAVHSFGSLVKILFKKIDNSLAYDMFVLLFGSTLGRLSKKTNKDGYLHRYAKFFDDLKSSLAFIPISFFYNVKKTGKLLDKFADYFRPRKIRAEAKVTQERFIEEIPESVLQSDRVFRYSGMTFPFKRSEPLGKPDNTFEPNTKAVGKFIKALDVHAPIQYTVAGLMKALGSSVYAGDVFVTPLLTTTKNSIILGENYRMVYLRSTETLLVVRPYGRIRETDVNKELKRLISLERRRGLNIAFVDVKTDHIMICAIRFTQIRFIRHALEICQGITEISNILLERIDHSGYLSHRTLVGYRDTRQLRNILTQDPEYNTQGDDCVEENHLDP